MSSIFSLFNFHTLAPPLPGKKRETDHHLISITLSNLLTVLLCGFCWKFSSLSSGERISKIGVRFDATLPLWLGGCGVVYLATPCSNRVHLSRGEWTDLRHVKQQWSTWFHISPRQSPSCWPCPPPFSPMCPPPELVYSLFISIERTDDKGCCSTEYHAVPDWLTYMLLRGGVHSGEWKRDFCAGDLYRNTLGHISSVLLVITLCMQSYLRVRGASPQVSLLSWRRPEMQREIRFLRIMNKSLKIRTNYKNPTEFCFAVSAILISTVCFQSFMLPVVTTLKHRLYVYFSAVLIAMFLTFEAE